MIPFENKERKKEKDKCEAVERGTNVKMMFSFFFFLEETQKLNFPISLHGHPKYKEIKEIYRFELYIM